MADTGDTAAPEEESGGQEGTLTKEQVEQIVKERLEDNNKQWQSRFDKLRTEKEEAVKKAEDSEKTAQEKIQEEVSSVRQELENQKKERRNAELRAEAQERVSKAGLELDDADKKVMQRLIDPEAEEPLADVEAWIERERQKAENIKSQVADDFAKRHGRTVTKTDKNGQTGTMDDYTDEQIKQMSDKEFEEVMARTRKAEKQG